METSALSPARTASHAAALTMYRWRSPFYDWQLAPYEYIRQRAIEHLHIEPGQTVLDIGCGTGMSLPLLVEAVGPHGNVTGVEQCPQMIEMAQQRVQRHGWRNVDLLCSSIDHARLPPANAVLLHFTHDILQSPQALDRILGCLRPGAHIACTGLKWTTSPYWPALNALVYYNALQSVTNLHGLDCPWAPLLDRGLALEVETTVMGTIFVASGQFTGQQQKTH